MNIKKSEVYASVGTTIFCVVLLLILLFFGLMIPREEMEEGIMVSFSDELYGGSAPAPVESVMAAEPSASSAASAPATPAPPIITQEEPSAPIVAQKTEKPSQQELERAERARKQAEWKAEQERKAEEARKAAEAEAARKAEIASSANSRVAGAFGKGGTSSASTSGKGSTSGNTMEGNPLGHGSEGGNSWSLSGRNIKGSLQKPGYSKNIAGKIVVNIKVDAAGNVTEASIAQGTNIADDNLRKESIAAAKRTKFSSGQGISMGTITYNFVLN